MEHIIKSRKAFYNSHLRTEIKTDIDENSL